jgi:glycosyltransferase involved in cell wall biosynthesis
MLFKKIAIFQGCWPLQIHTINVIRYLIEREAVIDLFLYDVDLKYVDDINLSKYKNLNIFNFKSKNFRSRSLCESAYLWETWKEALTVRRVPKNQTYSKKIYLIAISILKYMMLRIRWDFFGGIEKIIDKDYLNDIRNKSNDASYDLIIGVESVGLVLANHFKNKKLIKMLFYSLEIGPYQMDMCEYIVAKLLRKLEAKAHNECDYTLIQDIRRWEILKTTNRAEKSQPIYLPVSLRGSIRTNKSSLLYDKLQIPKNKKIVLLKGIINKSRFCEEIISASYFFPDEWTLVLHGVSEDVKINEKIPLNNTKNLKVIVSRDKLPSNDLEEFVSSAHIGLAFYTNDGSNNYHTGYSSEKVALYAKCGIPIISFNYPTYEEVFKKYTCGETIPDLEHLPAAVQKIYSNYEVYQKGAWNAFKQEYDFDAHFNKIYKRII